MSGQLQQLHDRTLLLAHDFYDPVLFLVILCLESYACTICDLIPMQSVTDDALV